jgi:uncharacterized protein YdaU (DUF1376 family)
MKAPAFQFYAGDYFIDTFLWSNRELGAYTRLLSFEWSNGPLPSSMTELAKIASESRTQFVRIWDKIRHKFNTLSDTDLGHFLTQFEYKKDTEYYVNLRLEETRIKQSNYSEVKKKVAQERWNKEHARALHVQEHVEYSPSPSPSPTTKNKRIKKEKTVTASVTLPSEIDEQVWKDFVEMRVKIKAPLTERAKKEILADLEKIGEDKNEVLKQSIKNSWRGVFELRVQKEKEYFV